MKYTVVTTFHQAGLELYGQKMIDTFEKFWPDSVNLVVYAENCSPVTRKSNVQVVNLLEASKPCKRFVKRHRDNPEAHGGPGVHNQHKYNAKKQFKWDAVRFCYKVFSIQHACANINSEWLIWLDADTKTHSYVPEHWLSTVCPDNKDFSYLGRTERYHSECGWVGYHIANPIVKQFIADFSGMYEQDTIFDLQEWHDSFVWDHVRRQYQEKGAEFFNINPEPDTKGLAGHPFINSDLGKYMDHMKGERKIRGQSEAREVRLHADHPYWRNVLGIK
jgi:hypothetical protein